MALLAALISAVLASAKDLISKRLSSRLDGTASTFASFAYALPFYVLILASLYFFWDETFTLSWAFLLLVLLRSITDTLAEWLKMSAFTHGDISLVVSFFSLSPVIMLFTSPLITGDIPSLWGSVAVVIVTIGSLYLVYRPSTAGFAAQKKAILLATLAAVFFSLNSCFDRLAVLKATELESELRSMQSTFVGASYSGFSMTLLSAIFLLPFIVGNAVRRESLRTNWRDLWLRGFLEATFMVCKLSALVYLQAPYVAGMMRFSLVLSIIGGKVFFKEPDFPRRLAAGILILGGIILIACLEK